MTLTLGSLFSGYGGLDMAVHAAFGNVETRWVSDIEPGPCKVLAHRHPGVPNLGDITQVDWTDVEPVDIIAGGSPCQDISLAGSRRGMLHGTRSGLWESMREAIAIIKPAFVVWENVRGSLHVKATSELEQREGRVGETVLRALGRVLGDLTDLGYDCGWETVRASDVGAPQERERVFLLATRAEATTHTHRIGHQGRICETRNNKAKPEHVETQVLAPILDTSLYEGGQRAYATRVWVDQQGYAPRALARPSDKLYPEPAGEFYEWVMGLPEGWITDAPGVTNDEVIRLAGNGVVPQQATLALELLMERMSNND